MRTVTPKDAIQKKVEVQEAEKTAIYGPGSALRRDPQAKPNLFFVGPRGSGKTTVARAVAADLGRPFVDTDQLVVVLAGQSIADLVASQGWEAFRHLESQVLAQVCESTGQVVATGGGLVEREANRRLLAASGATFYLMAHPPLLLARLTADSNSGQRPPLSALPLEEEIRQTLERREPLYLQLANFLLPAEAPVAQLVAEVREKLLLV